MVMLDPINFTPKMLTGKALRQQLINSLPRAAVPKPFEDKPGIEAMTDEVAKLPQKVGATVLIDGNVIDIGEGKSGFIQAIGDCLRRKACPVFHPPKTLLLSGRKEYAIPNKRC